MVEKLGGSITFVDDGNLLGRLVAVGGEPLGNSVVVAIAANSGASLKQAEKDATLISVHLIDAVSRATEADPDDIMEHEQMLLSPEDTVLLRALPGELAAIGAPSSVGHPMWQLAELPPPQCRRGRRRGSRARTSGRTVATRTRRSRARTMPTRLPPTVASPRQRVLNQVASPLSLV